MKLELESVWILIILLSFLQIPVSISETFRVLGPAGPVVAAAGEDTVLPCYLSPSISVLDLEIRWFRGDFSELVFLYRKHKNLFDYQLPSYKGRTDLFPEEFPRGNASLSLKDVRGTDDGLYTCLVQSADWYKEAMIDLAVRALGTQPSVSLHSTGGGQTQLVCRSEGWFPAPAVTWTDRDGQDVTSLSSTTVERDSRGLLSVSSYLPVKQESNIFSCLVRSSVPYPDRGSLLHISEDISPGPSGWMVALLLTLILSVGLTNLLIKKWRKLHDFPQLHKELDRVTRCCKSEWEWVCSAEPADVALDPDTAHCELIISGSGKVLRRGNWRVVSDNPKRFNRWFAVVSKEGFSSGRHYWEVKVNSHCTIGITRESALSKGAFSLTPREGYWILQCDPSHLVVRTYPEIHLPPHLLPRRLGVCLDVEEKQVSFYRVETRAHIYTFSDLEIREGEKLFPFFRTLDNANFLTILSPADCRK